MVLTGHLASFQAEETVCAKNTCLRRLCRLEQQESDVMEDLGAGWGGEIAGYETETKTGPENERP